MSGRLLIYGATGYTGQMVAQAAKDAGLDIVLAGRGAGKLAKLALKLDAPSRAFAVDDAPALHEALGDCAAVLNCAGPFAATARPIIEACLATGAHYLDITAEFNVYALAEALSDAATKAGAMLLPGVGWDVVPSDALAVRTVAQVGDPQRLRIALQVAGSMSRGSAISAGEIVAVGLLVRQDGKIVAKPDAASAEFNFGEGYVECFPLSFGDLVTAWRSTSVPNIEMFVHVTGAAFPQGDLSSLPDGPSAQERDENRARVVVEVLGADGSLASAMIETVNGYSYTPLAAAQAALRVLGGEYRAGFQTPATVFGPDFAASIPGTRIIDL
ncbi:trans-acting enoyl reductase family protein [Caulobacter sp. 602-1]|uniref:saccharopine dehydrogenase family protein n=1 Tax=Caulobacter sp. 602-1 TaxID=2492472 RepID=UPI000F6440C7|nr:saccharopine dehydrogenase NADP-binding domain-containing protein [Caulobacter sp. 602-1]RRN63881.1 hypothetical protein EIK80_14025 [Caulobacter sp. 602-1]